MKTFFKEKQSGLLACFCMNDPNVGLLLTGCFAAVSVHLVVHLVICVAARGARLPG